MVVAAAGCAGKEFTPSPGAAGLSAGGTSGGDGSAGGSGGTANLDPPADMGGDYMVSLTNGQNTCATVTDWTEGQQSTGIPVSIVQDGTILTAEVGGAAALYFILLTGDYNFTGEIHGNEFTLTCYGTRPTTAGNCTYTVNAIITGTVDGNAIQGTMTYQPALSDNPDCAQHDCQAEQAFSGSRPPPG